MRHGWRCHEGKENKDVSPLCVQGDVLSRGRRMAWTSRRVPEPLPSRGNSSRSHTRHQRAGGLRGRGYDRGGRGGAGGFERSPVFRLVPDTGSRTTPPRPGHRGSRDGGKP
jgi:hypothetical protein